MQLLVPMAGRIDKASELARLDRERTRLRQGIERGEKKLGNAGFVEKAPAEVVNKERRKVDEARSALVELDDQYARIEAL
jgi:valyl-tRNA synthetase